MTLIHSYSRAQAIEDGELLDANCIEPGITREAGFIVPVAFSRAAWQNCVHWDEQIEANKPHATGQDPVGRLWDVLKMAHLQVRGNATNRAMVSLLRIPTEGPRCSPDLIVLTAHSGPGDRGEHVVTITLAEED